MSLKPVNKILFISLSNIGDCILTLPAMDALHAKYPEAKITVLAGERPREIFENHAAVHKFVAYDKHAKLSEKIKLFQRLKKEKFGMVVDLRNTFYGAFLPARCRISPFLRIPKNIMHMKDRHLYKIRNLI